MITSQSKSSAKKFKFQGKKISIIALAVSLAPVAVLDIIAIYRNQFDHSYFIFFWLTLWCYLYFLVLMLFQNSDLSIDDTGVERFLFGKAWQNAQWSKVTIIREFPLYSQLTKSVLRGFHIISEKPSFMRFMFARKIAFRETTNDFPELIDTLNYYIDKYQINTEVKVNGKYQKINKLAPPQVVNKP